MTAAENTVTKAFGLDDEGWRRHANPWSVYTRIPIPALLALGVWSRDWIGWYCLIPVIVVVAWTWYNPRAFPPPASTEHWASKSVLGEKFYGNREQVPIPAHHRAAPWVLTGINSAGFLLLVWGLVIHDPWMSVAGLAIHMAGKTWFLDRMVWLYEDMAPAAGQAASSGRSSSA